MNKLDREWIRWLSYKINIDMMKYGDLTKSRNLNAKEKEVSLSMQRNAYIKDLFEKSIKGECTLEEKNILYDYITNNDIDDFIFDALSKKQLFNIKKKIECLVKHSTPVYKKYVDYITNPHTYDDLNIEECTIAHFFEKSYVKDYIEINRREYMKKSPKERFELNMAEYHKILNLRND